MPSDRSTLHRGSARSGSAGSGFAGSNDQRASWPEPTAPVGRRLPSAPRERKPALAALAVLLIIGGALGAGFLVIQSGKRVAAIEISQQIGAGQQIPLSAIQQVQITAGPGLAYVPWADASQVARYFTVSTIPAGTLLTRQMVATTGTSVAGRAVLGLALKDGQLPHGLQDGDHIDIYQVSDAQETCPGGPGWHAGRRRGRPRHRRTVRDLGQHRGSRRGSRRQSFRRRPGRLQRRERDRGHRGPARRRPGRGRRRRGRRGRSQARRGHAGQHAIRLSGAGRRGRVTPGADRRRG